LHTGERVLLVRGIGPDKQPSYGFYDFQRSNPLALLALAFAVVVVVVSAGEASGRSPAWGSPGW